MWSRLINQVDSGVTVMLQHCWHDVNVKFLGRLNKTLNTPSPDGRVCCYCGEIRPEPLPPMRPKRAHGPFIDDDSEWWVLDEAECPGLGLVQINPETVIVPTPWSTSSLPPGRSW